ncbi:MAG: glycosyltransferase family 4 protein, partial [Methanobacteriota archaeon]
MRSSTGSRGVARPHASVTLYGRASHPTGSMRVAVLHDHLSFIGGGERVALALAGAFDADLFVTDLDPGLPTRAGLRSVRATELGKAPRTPILRQERQAAAFRRAELPGYDVYVFSGNWAIEAAPRHRPNLWYCHTPTRVFYDLREDFLRDLSPPKRVAARAWIRRARPRYEADVATIGRVVANSRNVAGRVARYLHRSAEVVYPPVDTARY